jgi:3-hydroxyisobutyrate dehydrogenase-like beta-hydroxyacid dehydrogenase
MVTIKKNIGIIGLGAMGSAISSRLINCGFTVIGYDIKPNYDINTGVNFVKSAKEVGDLCDIVFGCVVTPESYRSALLGEEGLSHGSMLKYYVHIGTSGANLVKEISEAFKKGVITLDAPITGGIRRASQGKLTVITSGPLAALKYVDYIFKCYANKIVFISEYVGEAQTVKLINNFLSAANLAVASEALFFGIKKGIDPSKILEVVNAGTGQSDASLNKISPYIITKKFNYGGSMRVSIKDLGEYYKETNELSSPNLFATAVNDIYNKAADNGYIDGDITHIAKYIEDVSNSK